MSDYDLAVIGAGVVGVSTALWSAMRGHRVVLIDPAAPGSGTSSGNACTIATYACLPVNDPSVLTGLPGLLLGGNTPLSVSWGHALRHPLWMLRFLANCRAKPSSRIAAALAGVLAHADAGLNPLIEAAGAQDLVVARGQISVWSTRAGGQGAEAGLIRRRDLGVSWQEMTPEQAQEAEPGLRLSIARAVHFPDARHIRDPEALVGRFHAAFLAKGGAHLTQRVLSVAQRGEGVVVSTDAGAVTARRAVVAAGAFSGRIAGSGAENLPLGTERGYHLMFRDEAARVTRPVGWGEGGFYAVPMARGLRLAGTVEIAGLDAPANAGRLVYLKRHGQEMLGPLPDPDSSWLGFRPTLPDSLPAIGFAPGSDRILHAFGHQHLGLTLGGITGRIITDLAEGRQPNLDIAAFDPGRAFS
ncbi:NAD(P)/FAD-dependent oxidoreductase [Pseudooceanicola nitratireducens]|uniref:NAD(P)/FAD-dependent oxidoreductase n=1 Tax=Pseudooceanicola nitratireducens TaxID=517719 RepID=UPI0035197B03